MFKNTVSKSTAILWSWRITEMKQDHIQMMWTKKSIVALLVRLWTSVLSQRQDQHNVQKSLFIEMLHFHLNKGKDCHTFLSQQVCFFLCSCSPSQWYWWRICSSLQVGGQSCLSLCFRKAPFPPMDQKRATCT